MITPLGNGRFLVNGVEYPDAHAAIRALNEARAAQPTTGTPPVETPTQRARRERREYEGK